MQALIFISCSLLCTAVLVSIVLLWIKKHVSIIGIDANQAEDTTTEILEDLWRK